MSPTAEKDFLLECQNIVLTGGELSAAQAQKLATVTDLATLFAVATAVTKALAPQTYNLCNIRNAKAGKCTEDCKWCAQSAQHECHLDSYELIDTADALHHLAYAKREKIQRFSLVTSGKKLSAAEVKKVAAIYREMNARRGDCELCGSFGLLNAEQLAELQAAGLKNLHCNLETAPSFFAQVCTTHTLAEKEATLYAAKQLGLGICCGGIIGLGETAAQRVELALALRPLAPHSIPLNVLDPIDGTALAQAKPAPLSEDEILKTIAIFRLIHPKTQLRFAGGRRHFSAAMQEKAVAIGINAAVSGGLLTTSIGATPAEDHTLFSQYYTRPEK
jgi:biotin synthase